MSTLSTFNELINYIEENLFSQLNVTELAKRTKLSVYEFRRIFSFVVGTPVYEYIRKRRLSLSAKMIMDGEDVCAVSAKCGYDNVSSFLRAFKEFYGFTPNEVSNRENKLHTFTKAGLDVVVRGGVELDYNVVNLDEFYVCGVKGESNFTDTECCENVWQQFDLSEFKNNNPKTDKIYAVYFNGENSVTCFIGKKAKEKTINSVFVPKSKWVKFSCKGFDDKIVNEFYTNVLYNFFESSGYVKNDKLPNLETFPIEMEGDFVWDIYVPIV